MLAPMNSQVDDQTYWADIEVCAGLACTNYVSIELQPCRHLSRLLLLISEPILLMSPPPPHFTS